MSRALTRRHHQRGPTTEQVASELANNRRTRGVLFLAMLGLGLTVHFVWAFIVGAVRLTWSDEAADPDLFGPYASGWSLGLNGGLAASLVFAVLALTAVLTIAMATSADAPHRGTATSIAAAEGWLATLTVASLVAAAMGLAVAVSQVAGSPHDAVGLIVVAVIACGLWSGLQVEAHGRVQEVRRRAALKNAESRVEKLQSKIPLSAEESKTRRRVRDLGLPLTLIALVMVPAWSARTSAWVELLILFAGVTCAQLFFAGAAWGLWADGARWLTLLPSSLLVVISGLELLLAGSFAIATTPAAVALLALLAWLGLLCLLCLVPRHNLVARAWLMRDLKTAEDRLAGRTTMHKDGKGHS